MREEQLNRRSWLAVTGAAIAVGLDALVSPTRGASAAEDDPIQAMAKLQKDMKVGYDQLKAMLQTFTPEEKKDFYPKLEKACDTLLQSKDGHDESKKKLELAAATIFRNFSKLPANEVISKFSFSVEKNNGVVTAVVGVGPNERVLSCNNSMVVRDIVIKLYLQRVNNNRQHPSIEGVVEAHSRLLQLDLPNGPR